MRARIWVCFVHYSMSGAFSSLVHNSCSINSCWRINDIYKENKPIVFTFVWNSTIYWREHCCDVQTTVNFESRCPGISHYIDTVNLRETINITLCRVSSYVIIPCSCNILGLLHVEMYVRSLHLYLKYLLNNTSSFSLLASSMQGSTFFC